MTRVKGRDTLLWLQSTEDVAVKILRSEHLNESLEDEFAHEVLMLREVQHSKIVRYIGACTKQPPLCIITGFPSASLTADGGAQEDRLQTHTMYVLRPKLHQSLFS